MNKYIDLTFEEMIDDLNYLKIAVCFKKRQQIKTPKKTAKKALVAEVL